MKQRAPGRAAAGSVVGVLAKRGRFWTVEPFFDRGPRMNVDRPRDAGPGELVEVRGKRVRVAWAGPTWRATCSRR